MTCVPIESIGEDGTFSNLGGKYIWNPKERTIKLYYLYPNAAETVKLLNKYHYDMEIHDTNVQFIPGIESPGITTFFSDIFRIYNRQEAVFSLYYDNTIVGYNVCVYTKRFVHDENSEKIEIREFPYSFEFYYQDVVERIVNVDGTYDVSRDDVAKELLENGLGTLKDRYDSDRYTFLYYSQPTPHGTSEVIAYITNNGMYSLYGDKIDFTGYTRTFKNLVIDKESQIVTFNVLGSDKSYTLDLKTGELSE